MKTLMVSGQVALIDDEDFPTLSQYRWRLDSYGYALARVNGRTKSMHRMIMGDPPQREVDHINHKRLDNRKENLRVCTLHQNRFNRSLALNNSSGTTGVGFYHERWVAQIQVNRRNIWLGAYLAKTDAIRARKIAEIKYFGEFASR